MHNFADIKFQLVQFWVHFRRSDLFMARDYPNINSYIILVSMLELDDMKNYPLQLLLLLIQPNARYW